METELLSWGKVKTTLSPPWNQDKKHGENSWNVFFGVRNQCFLFLHPDTLEGSPCFLDIATWNFRSVGSPQMKLISETSNSQLLAPGCLCLPIFMQRKVKSNIKMVRKPICCFYVSNNDLHGIRGQKRQHCPKREWNQRLKLTRALTLQSHFHRNWPAKKQGKALKSVSFKMLELPCLCWSKCCYHRNRRSSRTSSREPALSVGLASRQRPCRWGEPPQHLLTPAWWHRHSGGKPDWDTPHRRGSFTLFWWKARPKMPWSWPQPCESCCCPPVIPVVFKTVTCTNTKHNIFHFGWWWSSGCQICDGLFIIIPCLVTYSSRVGGKLTLFHFPSPVPSTDRD